MTGFPKLWVPARTRANHAAIDRVAFLPASPLYNWSWEVLQISLASLGSTNVLHIVAKWMNHQVCRHIMLDDIYSSAELWVPLLGLVANYSLLSCGSQLGQGLIMQLLAGLDSLPAREGKFCRYLWHLLELPTFSTSSRNG